MRANNYKNLRKFFIIMFIGLFFIIMFVLCSLSPQPLVPYDFINSCKPSICIFVPHTKILCYFLYFFMAKSNKLLQIKMSFHELVSFYGVIVNRNTYIQYITLKKYNIIKTLHALSIPRKPKHVFIRLCFFYDQLCNLINMIHIKRNQFI